MWLYVNCPSLCSGQCGRQKGLVFVSKSSSKNLHARDDDEIDEHTLIEILIHQGGQVRVHVPAGYRQLLKQNL